MSFEESKVVSLSRSASVADTGGVACGAAGLCISRSFLQDEHIAKPDKSANRAFLIIVAIIYLNLFYLRINNAKPVTKMPGVTGFNSAERFLVSGINPIILYHNQPGTQ